MKRVLIIAILFMTLNINVFAKEFNLNSDVAIVKAGNQILYEKNETKQTSIASLTKIMTAIVVLENTNDLDKKVTISKKDFFNVNEKGLATAGFTENESVTIEDLLYGLMIISGAEAANALARTTSGSTKDFVLLMNEKAKELGMNNTSFANPVGTDEAENYSTGEDVLKMFNYALSIDEFKKIVTTEEYKTSNNLHTFTNHIRKNSIANFIEGGKTGTTDKAGLCLASFAYDKDETLILITLNSPLDYNSKPQYMDANTIYSYYINNYDKQSIVKKGDRAFTLSTKNSIKDFINFYVSKDKYFYLPNDFDYKQLKYEYSGIDSLEPGMKKGLKLGNLNVLYKGKILYTEDFYLNDNIKFSYIKYFKGHLVYIFLFIIIFVLIIKILMILIRSIYIKS